MKVGGACRRPGASALSAVRSGSHRDIKPNIMMRRDRYVKVSSGWRS